MKTKFTMALVFLLMGAATTTFAQGQMGTVEDRVKTMMNELAPLKLDDQQTQKTQKVFTDYYTSMQAMMKEAREQQQRPDRDKMMKQTDQRDADLKAIFTDEQYKKFKEDIEPSLRNRRRTNN